MKAAFDVRRAEVEEQESLTELKGRLEGHVEMLAHTIGPRSYEKHPGSLERAATFIETTWQEQGYDVRRQTYSYQPNGWMRFLGIRRDGVGVNLEATLRGIERPEEIVVIGAHYDSAGNAPGADDNASGVAALLEISREMRNAMPAKTVKFVEVRHEEPPYFGTRAMGSARYAVEARERGDNITSMIVLDAIGFYSDQPGSQKQHDVVPLPDTGNFLAFIGYEKSQQLVEGAASVFRRNAAFPTAVLVVPADKLVIVGEIAHVLEPYEDAARSDHASFWGQGYDAFMVTDTAFLRSQHYHTITDTVGTLDYNGLALVTAGLTDVVRYLAA